MKTSSMAISRGFSSSDSHFRCLRATIYFFQGVVKMANAQKGESLRENNKQLAIKELARIGRNTPYESVQNNVVNSITKLAENDQKSFLSRFCEPIALSVIANLLWE